jgi:hypothetical protein
VVADETPCAVRWTRRRRERFRWAVPVCSALLFLEFLPPPAAGQLAQDRVRLHVLDCPGRILHLFTVDLNGDGRRDLVVAHHLGARRLLSVFLQTPAGFRERPDQTGTLSSSAGALFVGDFTEAPGVEIGFLAPDGAYVYEREGERYGSRPRKLVHVPTFFATPSPEHVVGWMGRIDVDGNGFDDLFVPTLDGIRLYFQAEGRRFASVLDLPVAPETGASAGFVGSFGSLPGVAALVSRAASAIPAIADIDGDGLLDVLFIQGDRLSYFLQGPRGRFPATPTDVLHVPVLREFARKDRLEISLAQLVDVNRDGRADLVVTQRFGDLGDFGSIETVVYFFLARPPASGAPHPRRYYNFNAPDQQIRLKGFSPQDPEFGDANGDGFQDLMLSQITTETWGKILQVGVLREISTYYYLHLFNPQKGRFSPGAAWSRTVSIPTERIEGMETTWPHGTIRGDFNGDGRADYFQISGRAELTVHLGRPVYGFLSGDWDFGLDDYFRFELKGKPERVIVEELNGDKRADVILQYDDKIQIILSR